MIQIPDYALATETVAGWLQTAMKLQPGVNLFRDPTWPVKPDPVVMLSEFGGGAWDIDRGVWPQLLDLLVRAATVNDAHVMTRAAIGAIMNGFQCDPSTRNGIRQVRIQSLPRIYPRDPDNRVIIETVFALDLNAPFDYGV